MNHLIYYVIKDIANVCNPSKATNDSHITTSLAYLMPRPRRNAQTIIQTLEPLGVHSQLSGLFFHPEVIL